MLQYEELFRDSLHTFLFSSLSISHSTSKLRQNILCSLKRPKKNNTSHLFIVLQRRRFHFTKPNANKVVINSHSYLRQTQYSSTNIPLTPLLWTVVRQECYIAILLLFVRQIYSVIAFLHLFLHYSLNIVLFRRCYRYLPTILKILTIFIQSWSLPFLSKLLIHYFNLY